MHGNGLFKGHSSRTPTVSRPPDTFASHSCRWAELLDGQVLVRMMSCDLTGLCLHHLMLPERFRSTQRLLPALRQVAWRPERLGVHLYDRMHDIK